VPELVESVVVLACLRLVGPIIRRRDPRAETEGRDET
jgi:hypothetical protein